MNHPILHPDFRNNEFKVFIISSLIALLIAGIAVFIYVAKAKAEDNISEIAVFDKLSQSNRWIISETMVWCDKLSVAEEDKRLLQAIILAHSATSQPTRFANSDIGYASWIKMMRYLHDEAKDERPLLDFIVDWCDERWTNYADVWKDKVRIFLEEKREEINSDKSN